MYIDAYSVKGFSAWACYVPENIECTQRNGERDWVCTRRTTLLSRSGIVGRYKEFAQIQISCFDCLSGCKTKFLSMNRGVLIEKK